MKNTALALISGLLPQLANGCGFQFGSTDWTRKTRYDYTCLELATQDYAETNGFREVPNEQFALCLLERNSLSQLLTCNGPQDVWWENVKKGSIGDRLRIIRVDDAHYNDANPTLDNDGKTEVRVGDLVLMVTEMCEASFTTTLVQNVRTCTQYQDAKQFRVCMCLNRTHPRDIDNLQSCLRTKHMVNYVLDGLQPIPYQCQGKARVINKKPRTPRRSTDDNDDGSDGTGDDSEDCYLVYENGELQGSTGGEDCDFSPDMPYLGPTGYEDYGTLDDYVVTELPTYSTTTATVDPDWATVSVPTALVEAAPTDAAQSSAQAALQATGSPDASLIPTGSASMSIDSSALPTGAGSNNPSSNKPSSPAPSKSSGDKDSAAGSLRNGRSGSLEIGAAILCLVLGAIMY